MIELLEAKVKQLQEEVAKITNQMATLNETMRVAKAQYKMHQATIAKIGGAMEAFQATINVMKSPNKSPEVTAIEEVKSESGVNQ